MKKKVLMIGLMTLILCGFHVELSWGWFFPDPWKSVREEVSKINCDILQDSPGCSPPPSPPPPPPPPSSPPPSSSSSERRPVVVGNLSSLTDGVFSYDPLSEKNVRWLGDYVEFVIRYPNTTSDASTIKIGTFRDFNEYLIEFSTDGIEYRRVGLGHQYSHTMDIFEFNDFFPKGTKYFRISGVTEGTVRDENSWYGLSEFQLLNAVGIPYKPESISSNATVIYSPNNPKITKSLKNAIDGHFVEDWTPWGGLASAYWFNIETEIYIEYPEPVDLKSIVTQVDNNDYYLVEYSKDGKAYHSLALITPEDGTVRSGMKTVRIPNIDSSRFHPPASLSAKYFKIRAIGGDNNYSLSEFFSPSMFPTKITNPFGMEFSYIAPGSFIMGSPINERGRNEMDQEPHEVTLKDAYYMQTTEVTRKQWAEVMLDNPSVDENDNPDHPVARISYEEALNFVKRLNKRFPGHGYRLPTEEEWEYAARAGTTTAFAFGPFLSLDQANYTPGCVGRRRAVPVASYMPNNWGLYDMHGNVWEWTLKGVGRGGSFLEGGITGSGADSCRSASRRFLKENADDSDTGFRVVMSHP